MKMPIKMRIIENPSQRTGNTCKWVDVYNLSACWTNSEPKDLKTPNPELRSTIPKTAMAQGARKPGPDFDFDFHLGSDPRRKSVQEFGSDDEVRR